MGVGFGIESMRRIRDAQNNQNSRKGLREPCVYQTFLLYQDGMNYNFHFKLFDQGSKNLYR